MGEIMAAPLVVQPKDKMNITLLSNSSGVSVYDDLPTQISYMIDYQGFATMVDVELYCLPLICIFGMVGNTLATITFLKKPLRNAPCSFYLASRGISDNGFLFSLVLTWISSTFDLRLSHVKGVCQTIVFMTYLCGCVSVWLCVCITFENFLLIHSPFVARRLCCDNVTRICTTVLIVVAVGIYNTSLWIVNGDCSHNANFSQWTQVLVYTDTLLTLIIPTVVIFILLSMITYKVFHILHIRRLHSNLLQKIADRSPRPVKPIIPIAKVTKMLFAVSLTFFVLNVPSHAIRIMLLVGTFTTGDDTTPFVKATLQSIFQLMYYCSFSINIVVYTIFGSNFRHTFMKGFCGAKTTSGSMRTQTEAVNSVQRRRHSIIGNVDTNGANTCLLVPIEDQRRCHSECL